MTHFSHWRLEVTWRLQLRRTRSDDGHRLSPGGRCARGEWFKPSAGHEGSRIFRSRLLRQIAGHDQPGHCFNRLKGSQCSQCSQFGILAKSWWLESLPLEHLGTCMNRRFTHSSSWRAKLSRRQKARPLRHDRAEH